MSAAAAAAEEELVLSLAFPESLGDAELSSSRGGIEGCEERLLDLAGDL